jgi:hypothetical protein
VRIGGNLGGDELFCFLIAPSPCGLGDSVEEFVDESGFLWIHGIKKAQEFYFCKWV